MTTALSPQDLERYSRHVLLREFGQQGQHTLAQARILIIGAGGVGCPAALYLAESGVGALTLVDADTVEMSNLPRQILHRQTRLGMNKAESARIELAGINPAVCVTAVGRWADDALLLELCAQHDLVIDCCDNFRTRHAVNRAAQHTRCPLISASCVRYSGQIAVFDFKSSPQPCYQCLFPEDDAADLKASHSGVLAPVTGIVGALAATEAIKFLLGRSTLINKLLMADLLNMQFTSLQLMQDPDCPVCANAAGRAVTADVPSRK